ncbi:MAG: DUF6011 domain-containing protein [Promethearchaeota archaeon]
MSECRCKRCGRVLTNKKSIKRGYGSICYQIVQLNEPKPKTNEIPTEMINEIDFLKMEINFLKRQLKELRLSGVQINTDAIERIRKEPETPEKIENKVNFIVVINELKLIFKGEQFDYHDVLQPIESRTYIEESPIVKEILITN